MYTNNKNSIYSQRILKCVTKLWTEPEYKKFKANKLIYWVFGIESENQYIKGKIDQIIKLYHKGKNRFLPLVLSYFLIELIK